MQRIQPTRIRGNPLTEDMSSIIHVKPNLNRNNPIRNSLTPVEFDKQSISDMHGVIAGGGRSSSSLPKPLPETHRNNTTVVANNQDTNQNS